MKYLLGLFIAGCLIWATAHGAFYVTGHQWYEACWEKAAATHGFDQPKAPDANKAILWENCETTAQRALYQSGMLVAGQYANAPIQQVQLVENACPRSFNDVPMGGIFFLAVELVQKSGGPHLLDRVMPAEHLLSRVYVERWPTCSHARRQAGYPKLIEVSRGRFEWDGPCEVCELERKAMEATKALGGGD